MLSRRFPRAVSESEMAISCNFSALSGFRWTQHINLNSPANENSIDPSSSGLSPDIWKKLSKAFPLFFF